MPKIAFIGAGSFGFTRGAGPGHPHLPAPRRTPTLALMDIDPERLDFATQAVRAHRRRGQLPGQGRRHAWTAARPSKGADAVLCTILAGGVDVWRHDIEIPKKYGVDTNVGDTRGAVAASSAPCAPSR